MKSMIGHAIGLVLAGALLACGGSTPPPSGTPTPTATPTATPTPDSGRNYRVLHDFAAGADDAIVPSGALIQQGSTLYGMTEGGGSSNHGTIFQVGTDGAGFRLLHSFDGANGSHPCGSPIRIGATLFGMTFEGGDADRGTIFMVNADGTGFRLLHSFSEGGSDGYRPIGSLIQSGTILYGNTHLGGPNDNGVIFRISTDGTDYQVLHNFGASTGSDEQRPIDSLLLSGSVLYAATAAGGRNNLGAVLAIRTDGTGLRTLNSFGDGGSDGSVPEGGLTLLGATLYGMTTSGGSSGLGTVYRVNTDGTGFQVMHSFTGGTDDGAQLPLRPQLGSLVGSAAALYGMTYGGGTSDNGVVFQISTDGSGFRLLHRFTGTDGAKPSRALLLSGSTLYGMTSQGGHQNLGGIFAVDIQ
jgi:uncharacterized repeat protein (TIGR03803 family)